jgi:nitrite reductase (NADH) large subunit
MFAEREPPYFRDFSQFKPVVPLYFWRMARVASILAVFGVIAGLVFAPEFTLLAFWGVLVPVCPVIFVLAPGFWRQVCPFAAINQLPKKLGISRGLDLPKALQAWSWGIATTVFVTAIFLRGPYLNHSGEILAAVLGSFMVLALIGGILFKGRSGWCGTFCPLSPIQRVYGHAPAVVVRNGHCSSCVGCQTNCYDFNPQIAIFKDVYAEDTKQATARRMFTALLPGLILGYFLFTSGVPLHEATRLALMAVLCLVSVGLYQVLFSLTRLTLFQITNLFAGAALVIFYLFAGPRLILALGSLTGIEIPELIGEGLRFAGVPLAACLSYFGLRNERHYHVSPKLEEQINEARQRLTRRIAKALGRALPESGNSKKAMSGGPAIHDAQSGKTIAVKPQQTLLSAIEGAGLDIRSSCKSGMCGSDAVLITEGMEHLSPPSDTELETLRRMGLEGKARLACVCKTKGPVSIHRDIKARVPAAVEKEVTAPVVVTTGKAERIVVIGNGAAGMTAVLRLRRANPAASIALVTDEPVDFYNRMGLAEVIFDREGIYNHCLVETDWHKHHKIDVWRNTLATTIEREKQRVQIARDTWLDYDWLILATGAKARLPTSNFLQHPNAFVLRSADDANRIRLWCQAVGARRAVVVGGGTLGIEAADALQKLGVQVMILHRGAYLMDRHLDEAGAARLQSHLNSAGIKTHFNAVVERWEADEAGRIQAAVLASGQRAKADLFLACIGIVPNTELAAQAGLPVQRGILVDRTMRTDDPRILAIGDAAELPGEESGLWGVATRQAEVAVSTILGEAAVYTTPDITSTLKLEGIDVAYFGHITSDGRGSAVLSPAGARAWWKICKSGSSILGASYVGPPQTAEIFIDVLKGKRPPEELATLLAGSPRARAKA